jgi:hypothetical protein
MPARMRTTHPYALEERVMLSSGGQSRMTAGALASARWLRTIGMTPPMSEWSAELELVASPTTRFVIEVGHTEWSFTFDHVGRRSCIRVISLPAVYESDDFGLLRYTPPLLSIGQLVRRIEHEQSIGFRRSTACVHTTMPALVPDALRWLAQL